MSGGEQHRSRLVDIPLRGVQPRYRCATTAGTMHILGINALFHDPAAALVVRRRTVAAAEEERFSRRKHGKRPVPFSAWELPELSARLVPGRRPACARSDLDAVTYSFDPALHLPPEQLGRVDPWDEPAAALRPTRARLPRRPRCRGWTPSRCASSRHHVAHAASAGTGRAVRRRLRGAGARRPRRAAQPPGRPVARRANCRPLAQPAAAALARPALRGRHRAPGLPAQLGRVQGDGAGLLRQAALPRRPAAAGPRRPATAASAPPGGLERPCQATATRTSSGRPSTPTWPPACRPSWRRCCWTWPRWLHGRPAAACWRWPAASR